jgi:hypothetical protein
VQTLLSQRFADLRCPGSQKLRRTTTLLYSAVVFPRTVLVKSCSAVVQADRRRSSIEGTDGAMGENHEPNIEQLTVWRNLLDALGQLSSAWDAASEPEVQIIGGPGGDVHDLPEDLVTAFAHAGARGAEALAGVARVLAAQRGADEFDAVADVQRRAHQEWADAHRAISAASRAEGSTDQGLENQG